MYSAVREARARPDRDAVNTLLLVTFDEHGGLYDHVPPPAATPPGDGKDGEMGFAFDRLGCRVPAIAISAYTRAGTIVHDEMHHGALVRTLSRLHGLEPLTDRDASAPDLFGIVNAPTPRQIGDWPTTVPQYLPPNPEATPPTPRTPTATSRSARRPSA
ncbi:alkaline phosphatase family protein [Rathayibacter oskolensis]|uniref:alkaline phosphatase family protein n=1 Tax=Rathayibacter oskolensis TaxID=1891671 RepID=UPI00265DBA1A|nr:alkaline phosphatase family protein [Rathayibacter oskolensis]WKK71407.1 alkaline phosphatase family protein [Rathayibacter oskolensis]